MIFLTEFITMALTKLQKLILEILRRHPDGIDIASIREEGRIEGQQHLDKRIRELYPLYEIDRVKSGGKTKYRLIGPRNEPWDFQNISKDMRAKILARDGMRCQMCGKTVRDEHVKLHIDHRIPRSWGGETTEENLWSLCSQCNEGKKNYFSTLDAQMMSEVMRYKSVHKRIAMLLKQKIREWVPSDLIEFVANFLDYQTDWSKRLRELRYFGLDIQSSRRKHGRRIISMYRLNNWVDLPSDITSAARKYERERAEKNKRLRAGPDSDR